MTPSGGSAHPSPCWYFAPPLGPPSEPSWPSASPPLSFMPRSFLLACISPHSWHLPPHPYDPPLGPPPFRGPPGAPSGGPPSGGPPGPPSEQNEGTLSTNFSSLTNNFKQSLHRYQYQALPHMGEFRGFEAPSYVWAPSHPLPTPPVPVPASNDPWYPPPVLAFDYGLFVTALAEANCTILHDLQPKCPGGSNFKCKELMLWDGKMEFWDSWLQDCNMALSSIPRILQRTSQR